MSALDLCRPQTARAVARRFGLSPSRALSQSFLVDPGVRDEIAARAPAGAPVLEIGPGLGALTQGLLGRGLEVVAVEIDRRCVAALRLLRAEPRLQVVEADALLVEPARLGLAAGFTVMGNLPYGITGALLPRILQWRPGPGQCHLLVQREVAQRLAAASGGWSLSTLAVRLRAEVRWQFDVPPSAFWPQPRVHSSLLTLAPHPGVDAEQERRLLELARVVFQARRKQLHHGVARALGLSPAEAQAWLRELGLDPRRRPGSLDLAEWQLLVAKPSPSRIQKR